MTETKAQEFLRYICGIAKPDSDIEDQGDFIHDQIYNMPDHEFEDIIGKIRHNSARSKINDLPFPKLGENGRAIVCELLFLDHVCGLHTSYWSRTFWIPKGDKFVQTFPTNAVLDKFEQGLRKAKDSVYR